MKPCRRRVEYEFHLKRQVGVYLPVQVRNQAQRTNIYYMVPRLYADSGTHNGLCPV